MHLHHPSLSLNGKKKGKKKFASAAQAQQQRQLEQDWQEMQQKWAPTTSKTAKHMTTKQPYRLSIPAGRGTDHIPRIDSGHKGAVTVKQTQHYTGDKLLGIGVMHKSNLVPIFSGDDAVALSKMRRG